MTTFLFWNLRGNHTESWPKRAPLLAASLGRLAAAHAVDVAVLAECGFAPAEAVEVLNRGGGEPFRRPVTYSKRVEVFSRKSFDVEDRFNDPSGRLNIRAVVTRHGVQILVAVAHLPSQLAWSVEDQAMDAVGHSTAIKVTENDARHQRTVLVGDLNMDPFHPGVTGAQGFNGVMTQDLARREVRRVGGTDYPVFYNPMWGQFGDRTAGPPGTYFYQDSTPTGRGWHVFDQVLLRPGMMGRLVDLQVLDHDGTEPLVTDRGRPRVDSVSDHMPLMFRLDM